MPFRSLIINGTLSSTDELSSIPRQLAASPSSLFAIGIERPNLAAKSRCQPLSPIRRTCEGHRRAAACQGDVDRRLHKRAGPLVDCVGILKPASNIAYFHAVHASWRRYASNQLQGISGDILATQLRSRPAPGRSSPRCPRYVDRDATPGKSHIASPIDRRRPGHRRGPR
jgi:hypothetical protein